MCSQQIFFQLWWSIAISVRVWEEKDKDWDLFSSLPETRNCTFLCSSASQRVLSTLVISRLRFIRVDVFEKEIGMRKMKGKKRKLLPDTITHIRKRQGRKTISSFPLFLFAIFLEYVRSSQQMKMPSRASRDFYRL